MFDKGTNTGYQQFTVGTGTASGFTLPQSGNGQTEAALVRCESNNIRFRLDGSAPTSTTGYPIYTSDTQGMWLWGGGTLQNFKCISASGTATVDVLYFGLRE